MHFTPKYKSAGSAILLLSEFKFTAMLTENSEERYALLDSRVIPHRNLGKIPGTKNRAPQFVVRVSVNRLTLSAAFRPQHDLRSACRLADALTCYFWKYRIRETSTEADRYNYSKQQAELDLKNEPGLIDMLGDLEIGWAADGAIPSLADLAEQKRIAAIPTVKTALRKKVDIVLPEIQRALGCILDEQRQSVLTLRAEMLGDRQHLNDKLGSIDTAFKQILVVLTNLNSKIK
jgi:hypothetical protein